MSSSSILMLVTMCAYLVFMIAIGVFESKKNNSVSDYYLGGRRLGPLVTAMSAEASDMSSYLLMGLPGLAYLSGCAEVGWTIIGLSAGTYLNWLFTAKRLRRYTEETGSITVPSFFSNRYGDEKNILTFIAAIIIVIFFIPYTGSGFAACGKLFNSLFGIDYHLAMILSAVVILFYTTLGGFLAASTTDLVQSIVMTIALFVILVFGTLCAGGIENVISNAKELPGYFSMVNTYDQANGISHPYSIIEIISTLAWGLGYFGMPHILLRFMAIKDENQLKISRRIASIWALVSMFVSMMIGMIGLGMSTEGEIDFLEGSRGETVIVEISKLLSSYGVIAAIVAGVVLSGILASTMSTADSQLLAASSSISSDILVKTFHAKLSEKNHMVISRAIVVIIGILGVFLAWDPNSSVFQIVSFAWAGFGATFGPVMILALFWKRSNKYGALAGMVSGGIFVFVWKFIFRPMGGALDIYELLPAFIVALIVNVVVSLCTKEPGKEITEIYEKVNSSNLK